MTKSLRGTFFVLGSCHAITAYAPLLSSIVIMGSKPIESRFQICFLIFTYKKGPFNNYVDNMSG